MDMVNRLSPADLLDRLLVFPQYLLPQHLFSRLVYHLARCRAKPVKNLLIRSFIRVFNVDLSEAEEADFRAYRHFNHFFTRGLKPGARKTDTDREAIISPIDGYISQLGSIQKDDLLQAKGRYYSLGGLLAGDHDLSDRFRDGAFVTLYLSPGDYHRIHIPLDGHLTRMVYVPGRLFSVNRRTTRVVNGLFARNERVICLFETTAGPMALIMVGAINVGSMETTWHGEVTPGTRRTIQVWDYGKNSAPVNLRKGEEMGRFNMGSTVILLFGREKIRWLPDLQAGDAVKMGMPLAKIIN